MVIRKDAQKLISVLLTRTEPRIDDEDFQEMEGELVKVEGQHITIPGRGTIHISRWLSDMWRCAPCQSPNAWKLEMNVKSEEELRAMALSLGLSHDFEPLALLRLAI